MSNLRPALFFIDGVYTPVAGFGSGYRVNGWCEPWFFKTVVLDLIRQHNAKELVTPAGFDEDRDAAVFGTLDDDCPEEVLAGEDVLLADGTRARLYRITEWCWEVAEAPPHQPTRAEWAVVFRDTQLAQTAVSLALQQAKALGPAGRSTVSALGDALRALYRAETLAFNAADRARREP